MVFAAGQIGLVPSTMTLARDDQQPSVSLAHVQRVLMANGAHFGSAVLGICYYTTQHAEGLAKQIWRKVCNWDHIVY